MYAYYSTPKFLMLYKWGFKNTEKEFLAVLCSVDPILPDRY
jgi:hypothetical protein